MRDDVDDRLHDAVALDEINLFSEVLSAVAAADRPLTDDEIDAVLGLDRPAGLLPHNSRPGSEAVRSATTNGRCRRGE